MTTIFFDTSALVRRYDRNEPGSSRIRNVCSPTHGHTLLLAQIASVEVASAFARKTRDRTMRVAERTRLWRLFRVHRRDQYHVVTLTEDAYAHAERLLFQFPLRPLDAINLACALVVAGVLAEHQMEFWTADRQQAQAASAEALAVELVT